MSPQQAIAIVLSFVIYHNRKILGSREPLWDSNSLQKLKPGFSVQLRPGYGFGNHPDIKYSLQDVGNPKELCWDEDMKSIDIISNNVNQLSKIYTSLDGIITMAPEEILFCSPMRKVKNISETTKEIDPLFHSRLLDLGVKLGSAQFNSLTSLLLDSINRAKLVVDKNESLDIQSLVDKLGSVLIMVSDDIRYPILSMIPFCIKTTEKEIVAQKGNRFYLTTTLPPPESNFDAEKWQQSTACTCGRARKTKEACGSIGCPCLVNQTACSKECRCIACTNPVGKKPSKTHCGCSKGFCETNRYLYLSFYSSLKCN